MFDHRVIDVEDKGDFVLLTVKDAAGKQLEYQAQYVVAADGGKTVGHKIGVQMEGPTNLVNIVSTHFRADLSEYWDGKLLVFPMHAFSAKSKLVAAYFKMQIEYLSHTSPTQKVQP